MSVAATIPDGYLIAGFVAMLAGIGWVLKQVITLAVEMRGLKEQHLDHARRILLLESQPRQSVQ